MTKTNKRIRNATIQAVLFNIVVACILFGVLFSYIIPSLFSIKEKKQDLETILSTYERIEKEGLTLKEFKSLYLSNKDLNDAYIINLLKNLDEDFYTANMINTIEPSYSDFLEKKTEYTISQKSSEEFKQTDEKINTIIPSYSDRADLEGVISDFDFVSYIESLLFTFNLQTDDSIGIGAIEAVSYSNEQGEAVSTEASLFYIPLNLSLVGQKKDILDFIHFLENVGAISIQDGKIASYNDKTIKKAIEGTSLSKDYNIYENQLADIEYITMSDYIDSSPQPSNKDLASFIKTSQPRDRFEVEMKTRFYISGLPDYKVEAFINETVDKFAQTKKLILPAIKKNKEVLRKTKSGDVLFAVSSIESLGFLIDSLGKTTSTLKKDFLKDKTQAEKIYDKALEIDEQLDKIVLIYTQNQQIIDANN